MPGVTCPLTSCSYRGVRGACHRKHIVLQQTQDELNEVYCLGWSTLETRLFTEMMAEAQKRAEGRGGEEVT